MDSGFNDAFASIALTETQSTSIHVAAMQIGANSSCYVWYHHSAGSVGGTYGMNLAKINGYGAIAATVNYDVSDGMQPMSTAYFGGVLYEKGSKEGAAGRTDRAPF